MKLMRSTRTSYFEKEFVKVLKSEYFCKKKNTAVLGFMLGKNHPLLDFAVFWGGIRYKEQQRS